MQTLFTISGFTYPAGLLHRLALAPVLLISAPAIALTTVGPGQTLDINASTGADNYQVIGGGILNTSNAQTFEVAVQGNSTLNAVGGTFAGRGSNSGITVRNSQAILTDVTVTGGNTGLTFNRLGSSTTGSTGRLSGSIVSGGTAGIAITGLSTVELINTQVTGTLVDSNGITYFGGSVKASQNSTISGGESGVRMGEDSDRFGVNSLILDDSLLEGRAGSAIVIEQGIEATILLQNNARLQAGNGILLDVKRPPRHR